MEIIIKDDSVLIRTKKYNLIKEKDEYYIEKVENANFNNRSVSKIKINKAELNRLKEKKNLKDDYNQEYFNECEGIFKNRN